MSTSASPEAVWDVWVDVLRWPEWTASVSRADGAGPLALGRVFRLRQPRLPVAEWTVTELVEGRSFSWTSHATGVRTVATHEVRAEGTGAVVTARIEQTGPLAGVTRLVLGRLVRRYLELETAGLTARAEG